METRSPAKRILAWLLALSMCLSLLPGMALASSGETTTYTKITSLDQMTSGEYVVVVSSGYALGTLDGSWITAEAITADGNTVTNPNESLVWTLTVSGASVKLTDSNNVTIAPSGGNANGIKSGDYSWNVTCTDAAFKFLGHDGDTVTLASNTGSSNKFRAYKNTTVSGNPNGYPSEFTLYKLDSTGGGETETQVATPTAAPASGSTVAPGDTVTLSCATTGVTYQTSGDNSAWTPLEGSTFAIPNDAEGTCTIYVKAVKEGLDDSEVLTLTYTVEAPVAPTVVTIAGAKAMASGTENITVKGVVILADGKNIYVQDETGGIDLFFSSAPADISLGDLVQATGKRAAYKGLEELSGVTDYTVISHGNALPTKAVTIADILDDQQAGTLESTRVYIENAVIGAVNTSGNTTLTQGDKSINIYRCPALEGVSEGDTVSLYAVISDFNGYQLRVASAEDVTKVQADPVLTDTLSHLDKVYVYYPTDSMVLTSAASGKKLAGLAGTVDGNKLTVADGMAELVVSYNAETGYYQFVTAEGLYLTSAPTGNGLSFATEPGDYSLWTLESADGGFYIKNVNAAFNGNGQYIEYYSGFTTYGFNSGKANIYTFQFYKSGVAPSLPVYIPDEPAEPVIEDGEYVLWVGGEYNVALSSTKGGYNNFYNVGVPVTSAGGTLSGYGQTEVWTVTNHENGTITISQNSQNLGLADSYTSMDLGATHDTWVLEDAGNGTWFVKNVDRGNTMEFSSYGTWQASASISESARAAVTFTPAQAVTPPPADVADGTYVIWAPAYNKALSSVYGGFYNNGVDVTLTGSTLTGYGNTEIWTVANNDDGTISLSFNGQKLGMADSYSSMTLGEKHDKWTLESAGDGLWYVKNVGRGVYAQWYADKGYWSGYGTIKDETKGCFALQFTPAVPGYGTDASVTKDIAQWGGMTKSENTEKVYGDRYASGDELDTDAVFTAVANGVVTKPWTQGGTSPNFLYYMGGNNIGAAEGDYMQLAVNTAGWGDMKLSFRLRATKTAPGSFQLQYSTDSGATFQNFTTGSYSYAYTQYTSEGSYPVSGKGNITDGIAKTSLAPTYYVTFNFDVPAGADNCANLLIRLVAGTEKAGGASGMPGGTTRMDSVVLSGHPIVDDSITGYVTVIPDGQGEDQPAGTELTMTCATEGAVISYRVNGGDWNTYNEAAKPVLETLPCDIEVKASCGGKADSVILLYHYAAGTVSGVKMSPNGGGVYIPDGESASITLTCDTQGATIYYRTNANAQFTQYTTPIILEKGFGSLTLEAYAVKDGFNSSAVTKRDFTEMDSSKYSIYFGQLHSHTNISDGAGSVADAFEHAYHLDNLDFLAVTDHSNSFDNADSGVLSEDGSIVSTEWKEGHDAAAARTDSTFVGIYGYEMTWSNGLGHMNTFNTPGWQSRTQNDYKSYNTALKNYYDALKTVPESLSQFNHPGTTFGDFSDFAHYDEEIDALITMIEVGNGEGAIGSSGYFPSYEYYTRALDKGWHVAPSNNQDNHKGLWGNANTARSVVLATSLTQEAIYDAIRNYRVYATEDNDLSIYYTLDENIMGSMLSTSDVGDTVTITAELSDPTDSAIGVVEVIVNGGLSLDSQAVNTSEKTITFTVPSQYNYYYLKVTQPDGDIAVTAPVWIGSVEAVGISGLAAGSQLTVAGEEQAFTLDLYNNESKSFLIDSIQFSIGNDVIHTDSTISSVGGRDTASCTFGYIFETDGIYTITATVKGTLDGVEKTYVKNLDLTVMPAKIVSTILVDGTHYNDYVTGYYGGNMNNMTTIAAGGGVKVEVVTTRITADMLENCSLLVISAPARKAGTANAGEYTASTFSDEFIQLVKSYVEGGGNVAVCGLADYQDKGAVNGADGHAAAQINKLLAAIGSTMTINDDEVYDAVNNGGQFYRLYPSVFNTESAWTAGIVDGQTYSQYSGCSVNAGSGTWLVRGFDTTYSVDSDKDGVGNTDEIETDDSYGYNVVTPKGEVVFLACEETAYGGTIFAAGGVFLSDFEVKAELDNIWDLPYANRTIYENILDALCVTNEATPIAEVRQADPGRIFVVEGYVTSGTVNANTTFFDAIYVQDETGGITVFPYSETGLALGTKVRIIGYTDEYQGDREIQIISFKVLNEPVNVIPPEKMSCADAMDYAANGGKLVATEGKVSEIIISGGVVSQFKLTDSTGVAATVFIDGYITNPNGQNTIASWLKDGQTVEAAGLLYLHPEGSSDVSVPVLRVRNCDEIKLISEATPPVIIPVHAINIAATEHGTASATFKYTVAGGTVAITVTPDKGYQASSVTVTTASGGKVAVTGTDGSYRFTMPDSAVTVTVVFKPILTDVPDSWYRDDVYAVYLDGLMDADGTEFHPTVNADRATVVEALYRLACKLLGAEPELTTEIPYGDVSSDAAYAKAVIWGTEHGIVLGTPNGNFYPEDNVTREQLACFLYRTIKSTVGEIPATGDLSAFGDAGSVSAWAVEAMTWAVSEGLIQGATDGNLWPQGFATRCELAAILNRFGVTVRQ